MFAMSLDELLTWLWEHDASMRVEPCPWDERLQLLYVEVPTARTAEGVGPLACRIALTQENVGLQVAAVIDQVERSLKAVNA
jgi:hypothetical protein